MPWRLLFVISGILAGGIPGFCIELCCFPHPLNWPLVFLWRFLLLVICWGPASSWHTRCHYACNEMILSYHLLSQSIFFTHKLELVTSLLGGLCCFLFGLFALVFVCLCSVCVWFCFWFLFLCSLVFCLVFWMNVTVHRTMYRSSTSLLLRPLQQRPLRDLINQLIPTATCS